ncbi:hypothetical protein EV144_101946 [Flavobacterium sp. 270]|uniref:hypothetical protein n=1 Tax=Flavobacterium sp. 270 TaxID=2512114 RepID=UPI001066544D|nr:hypothetical protein [Flavobacterium sp. 270]TDW52258.1 hypothetical protein EV144_101946 [Flavobacterium sp. 270]
MKGSNFTKRIIQLIIVGGLFMFILYRSYQTDNIFANFFYLILSVLEIILLSNVISENFIKFKRNKKIQSLAPTFVAFFLIFSTLSLYIYYETLENSKTYIHAYGNGLIIDLKENGNYIIKSGSWGDRTHHYGTYTKSDSIIYLDKKIFGKIKITGEFKQGKIYIDKEKVSENVLFETYKSKTFKNADYFYIE